MTCQYNGLINSEANSPIFGYETDCDMPGDGSPAACRNSNGEPLEYTRHRGLAGS